MTVTIHPRSIGSTHDTSGKAAEYYDSLRQYNAEPLWTVLDRVLPASPNPSAVPTIWRYEDLRPPLMEAGLVVTAEEAERRVLMLINPGLEAPCTTDSIYAGLQLILPGEIAPAHRHVAFALRFIIEGSSGFTAVEGGQMMMERGDVILTPSWQWHDHGNSGTEPVIWLDGLDIPLFKFFRLNFAEPYAEKRYPSTLAPESALKFPWAPVEAALRGAEGSYAIHHYSTKEGKPLSSTLSAQAERISAGATSPTSQETISYVYHVIEGEGYSTVIAPGNGVPQKIVWNDKDTFAVPAWSQISHTVTSSHKAAFLFAINDRPMVESLGLGRDAGRL